MDDAVPGVSGVVDNDVNLAVAELSSLLDKLVDVLVVQHVARHGSCAAAILVDLLCNRLRFLCEAISLEQHVRVEE